VELVHADRRLQGNGAGGTRTLDLSDAIRTLFQLSYSPELVVGGEVYRGGLAVPGRRCSKEDCMTADDQRFGQQVTAIDCLAVGG
jgi:hypothetical protein